MNIVDILQTIVRFLLFLSVFLMGFTIGVLKGWDDCMEMIKGVLEEHIAESEENA